MKKLLGFFLILLASIILVKCASQTTPTGGPKDETPPKLKESAPLQNQTNFNGKTIELTFDELVQVNNPKEEIIINPNPGKDIQFIAKQNRVLIQSKNGWKDSTTYSISFNEGVQDLNEGNAPKELRLAFSTGTTIDSLSILGKVTQSLTEKIPEKITIALYQQDTFNIFDHTPEYSTRTKKNGFFKIANLKAGRYFVYAFDDKNKNAKVDSKTEKFGFLTDPIELKKTTDTLAISIYLVDSRPIKINSIRNTGSLTKVSLNKYLTSYKLESQSMRKLDHSFADDQTEINIYNKLEIGDSVQVQLKGLDSLNYQVDSTFYIKRVESKIPPEKFSATISNTAFDAETFIYTAEVKVPKPIKYLNLDSIYLTPDNVPTVLPIKRASDKNKEKKEPDTEIQPKQDTTIKKVKTILKLRFVPHELKVDSSKKLLIIKKVVDKKITSDSIKQLSLVIESTFIQSIENDSSERETNTLSIPDESTTGTLLIEVATQQKNYEVQLLGTDGKVLRKARNIKKHSFNLLAAQEYKIMVYIDLNNNGQWDPQNIRQRTPAEPCYFYKTEEGKYTFPIRASWELGPLVLSF
jgi:uncharacterized protein (DUF2141 family)